MRSIAIVGGSLAGLSAARALRKQGFAGQLSIVENENRRPYDRPPLSKAYLAGTATETEIALLGVDENLDADWRLGVTATALHPGRRSVELSDGSELIVDGVVLATGARPRQPWSDVPAGVHTLRTLDDARALRAELLPGARLVVVGAGFIGAEVAATAYGLGLAVTVLEAADEPLSGPLGRELGAVLAGLHQAHGVQLRTGTQVTGFTGQTGRVSGVTLADGSTVPADVVLIGVGVQPNTEWLAGSGLDLGNGVHCDAYGLTAIPAVVAVGDCATWYDPQLGRGHRLEHWTGARERAAIAVSALLSGGADRVAGRPPYFWSDQYGRTLQVAGHTSLATEVTIESGAVADLDFLAVYRRHGDPVAVAALGHGREFMRWRKQLATQPAVTQYLTNSGA